MLVNLLLAAAGVKGHWVCGFHFHYVLDSKVWGCWGCEWVQGCHQERIGGDGAGVVAMVTEVRPLTQPQQLVNSVLMAHATDGPLGKTSIHSVLLHFKLYCALLCALPLVLVHFSKGPTYVQ